MGARSNFSSFRHGIRMNLIKRYRWDPSKATVWVRSHKEDLRPLFNTGVKSYDVAKLAHELRDVNAN